MYILRICEMERFTKYFSGRISSKQISLYTINHAYVNQRLDKELGKIQVKYIDWTRIYADCIYRCIAASGNNNSWEHG